MYDDDNVSDEQSNNVDALIAGKESNNYSEPADNEPETQPEQSDSHNDSEQSNHEPENDASNETDDSNLDEYGNELKKEKLYTEDEVNERINKAVRDRLDRMNRNSPDKSTQDAAIADAQDNYQYDENKDGDWQQQLEQFIFDRLDKRDEQQKQKQIQQQERQRQLEFEDKFQRGMTKFDDFKDVVGQQPITDAMVVGTRGMNDPASFLYAASKNHADELKSIANMSDPYQQVAAMGRLETKMRQARKQTKAPEPARKTSESVGVVGDKSLDSMIQAHAKEKAKMRGLM